MHDEFPGKFGERARFDEPMSGHTTFGIGGPADVFVEVLNVDELQWVVRHAKDKDVPLTVLGCGANVLVSDDGIRGIVVHPVGELKRIAIGPEPKTLNAGGGALLVDLVSTAIKAGFNNFCWAAGIPGTVGAAVVLNAGSWGHSMGDFVSRVDVMDRSGEARTIDADEIDFVYRGSSLKGSGLIVTGVVLRLANVESEIADASELRADYLTRKRNDQPVGLRSAGCVFKNPPGESAGALIDSAGLKGQREGGACISEVHANFIVNEGGATASDVLKLVDLARERASDRFGIELEMELDVLS